MPVTGPFPVTILNAKRDTAKAAETAGEGGTEVFSLCTEARYYEGPL